MRLSAGAAGDLALACTLHSRADPVRHGAGVNQTRSRALLLSSPSSHLPRPATATLCTTRCCRPARLPRLAEHRSLLPFPVCRCPLPAAPRRLTCLRLPHTKERQRHVNGGCRPPQRSAVLGLGRPAPPGTIHLPTIHWPACHLPSAICPQPAARPRRHPSDVGLGLKGTAADQISAPGAEPAPVPPRIVVSRRAVPPPQALFQNPPCTALAASSSSTSNTNLS
jgi:hypothetical protein